MSAGRMILAAGAAWLVAGGALAQTCEERISELEAQLEEAAEFSISTSSGGQGVAGSREAQAMEIVDENEELEESAVPYQEEEEEAEAVERAEEAGEGGDLVMQARARVEEAGASAEEGDEAACEEALADATELLDEFRLAQEEAAGTSGGTGDAGERDAGEGGSSAGN